MKDLRRTARPYATGDPCFGSEPSQRRGFCAEAYDAPAIKASTRQTPTPCSRLSTSVKSQHVV